MIDLSNFTHEEEEEEPLPEKVMAFSDGQLFDFREFPHLITYETLAAEYSKSFADEWWNDKVLKVKWNIKFEGLEKTNLGG